MSSAFQRFAHAVSKATGHAAAFVCAVLIVAAWLVSGPIFHYSDTWQLVINTATTVVTFLMVFILQNTQNRDNEAVQIKLDELLRAIKAARTSLVDIEELPDEALDRLFDEYRAVRDRAQKERSATGSAKKST